MSSAEEKERRAAARHKDEAQLHTKFLNEGLTPSRIKPFTTVTEEDLATELSELARLNDQPIWEVWCQGDLARWSMMQWALAEMSSRGAVAGLGRFLLCTAKLNVPIASAEVGSEAGSVKRLCNALKTDTGADPAVGEESLPALHALTRKAAYDVSAFTAAIEPLLGLIDGADVTSADFISSEWGKEYARGRVCLRRPFTHDNFLKPMILAVGGFGVVDIAWNEIWAKPYALKRQNMAMIVGKEHIDKLKIEWRVHMEEKDVVISLRFMSGGDLSNYMKQAKSRAKKEPEPTRAGHFGLDMTSLTANEGKLTHSSDKKHAKQALCRFYLASTLLGLEALHAAGFVYRDLKDMNILLDAYGQARLADFGLCADVSAGPTKGCSGTKGYWAPEQIPEGSTYTHSPDFWTFGVCCYHWSTGKLPFPPNEVKENDQGRVEVDKNAEKEEVKAKIMRGKYEVERFPEVANALKNVPHLKELLDALLVVEPSQRLGYGGNGWSDVKAHPYWKDFKWEKLERGLLIAPIIPPKTKMNATMPSTLKEEFAQWAEKETPPEAETLFGWWPYVNLEAQEALAIEACDLDIGFFRKGEEAHSVVHAKVPWVDLTSVDSKATLSGLLDGETGGGGDEGGSGGGDDDGGGGGGGGGCCAIS